MKPGKISAGKILAIDDEKNILHLIQNEFSEEGFEVTTAETGEQGLEIAEKQKFDLVFLDIKLPKINGIETLKRLKQKSSATEVIMITGHGEVKSAVESIKLGARDYITKPFKLDELLFLARQVIEDRKTGSETYDDIAGNVRYEDRKFMLCPNQAMQNIYRIMKRVAPTDNTILILGETGVGKDVLAAQIHLCSKRKKGPFITLDCGMLNHNLAESELYGHRKGAFSGAGDRKEGLVEKSNGGTLFLDEIGNIDINMQKKFLRFLETGKFRRLGETREISVDARIILATNIDLHQAVEKGLLRKDLLYRMDVISITLPPLRERQEDIIPLSEHLLELYGDKTRKIEISQEAARVLTEYSWPGNIRELKSVITKALLFSDSDILMPDDLPEHLNKNKKIPASLPKTLEEMEKEHIMAVLDKTGGHQTRAAELLGINRKTLYKKIHKYNLFS
ncbi:Two component system response regulator, sigma54-specific [Desulfonema limicola]|uniref:Two component system response regulator, sigma54-specific n=1 Tax=Desulfonema limicola TaxID=45656 RepID=A0A975GHH3_9BACT|nr:sigma-54 dependent transcriptional regulator [Desulfonema limicola]QTA81435.1 Two component system response regulator, sigma54-specific [Desulfonema limicola]